MVTELGQMLLDATITFLNWVWLVSGHSKPATKGRN
jgi:hypothetical protein